MINVSDKICREITNIYSTFFIKNLMLIEIMWKNNVQSDSLQRIILHMRIARWINEATNTHS